MPKDTILCWKSNLTTSGNVTVEDYQAWLSEGETAKGKIANFFRDRMRERYVEPILASASEVKNGFSIMALSCLMIETYETFRQGWPSSDRKSEQAFIGFFDREDLFRDFKGLAPEFYKNVRCGILHQGETTKGWQITRESGEPLFDKGSHTIHATKFHTRMAEVIDSYKDALVSSSLTDDIWKHFIAKMTATIENCEP